MVGAWRCVGLAFAVPVAVAIVTVAIGALVLYMAGAWWCVGLAFAAPVAVAIVTVAIGALVLCLFTARKSAQWNTTHS